jgi:hypothetical protein
MRRTVSNLIVIGCQLLIVGLFFGTVFDDDIKVEKYVSTIHNKNLDKIATSVSLLFKEETPPTIEEVEKKLDDMTLEELPSKDVLENDDNKKQDDVVETKKEIESTPLVSVDASKYSNNEDMGFNVTEGNKTYDLNDYEFDVVVAVVSGEFDKNFDDALGVVSVILNRCDSDKWRSWAGSSPYQQVIRAGQFEVYFGGSYLSYMPGGSQYGGQKYNIAKQAVIDGLNGIRNNEYLGFRAWFVSSYSDKYIVYGGNRYGYN